VITEITRRGDISLTLFEDILCLEERFFVNRSIESQPNAAPLSTSKT
jgi:hypothetical protein